MEANYFAYLLFAISAFSFLFFVLRAFWIFLKKRSATRNDTPQTDESTGSELPDVCGPDGEKIFVSVGPKRNPLPKPNDEIRIIERSAGTVRNECGHDGPKWYQLDAYGVPTIRIADKKMCPVCLMNYIRRYVTRCSLCGLPIFPGDSVALYHESSRELRHKAVAARVGESRVGCLRWDCCPSGGFFAGYWTEDGFRSAFVGD